MVKTLKRKDKESLEFKLKEKLNNFNPSEVESYLELLLRKCLAATIEKDYLTLGNVEDILNKSIVILGSKVKNFNLMYSNLKLKVATEELAKYIELDKAEAFNFFNVLPEFITTEEAKQLEDVEDYKYFTWAKNHIYKEWSYYELFENEKYSIIYDSAEILILEKEGTSKIAFESWDGNLEVLEAFVKDSNELKPTEALDVFSIMADMKQSEKDIRIEKGYGYIMEFFRNDTYFNFEKANINYFKENEKYIAIVTSEGLLFIIHKETAKYNTFSFFIADIKDNLFSFLDYCLGVPTEEAKVPEVKVIEVYNIFLKVLTEATVDLEQLINFYNENPSDKTYNLINRKFFRIQENIDYIKHLLEEPYIADNVEPEVLKAVYNDINDFNSISSEVLKVAKQYNKEHTEEAERIHKKYLENLKIAESMKSLNIF